MALGAFPDSHRQHLGMPGMHGTVAAVAGLQRSDLIISLGARFDDRVTGNLDSFAPVVVDFRVHRDAMVWPMVAAGTSNDDIKVARDMAPVWDGEEL